jgi:hypothetical protein
MKLGICTYAFAKDKMEMCGILFSIKQKANQERYF